VRLPNRGGVAAGATVPVFALGSIDCRRTDGSLVEEGHWEPLADGVVSADGRYTPAVGIDGVLVLTGVRTLYGLAPAR
jgi:hypothetical protein